MFDLGGVLIDWDRRYLYRSFFDDEAAMEDFLASVITPEWNRRLDGGADWDEEVEALSARFPHHAQAIHAYRDRWEDMLAGSIDDTVKILADLRGAGYELHALTNWSARTFPIARERFAFLDWFGEIVVSGEVGMTKPDEGIYRILLERIGHGAAVCLFIDDASENVDAARRMGFDGIVYRDPAGLRAALTRRSILLDDNGRRPFDPASRGIVWHDDPERRGGRT